MYSKTDTELRKDGVKVADVIASGSRKQLTFINESVMNDFLTTYSGHDVFEPGSVYLERMVDDTTWQLIAEA